MPITFHDDRGIRWTVVARPAPRADAPHNEGLVFTSEAGERRTCDGCLPEGATWEDVDVRVWRALLRHADAAPAPQGQAQRGDLSDRGDAPADRR